VDKARTSQTLSSDTKYDVYGCWIGWEMEKGRPPLERRHTAKREREYGWRDLERDVRLKEMRKRITIS